MLAEKWNEIMHRLDLAKKERQVAEDIVTSKFFVMGNSNSGQNPTEEEMQRADNARHAYDAIWKEAQEFVRTDLKVQKKQ